MIFKKKKDHDQKPWRMLLLLSLLFYGSMLSLTLLADDIHDARLPKVTAGKPMQQSFTYTLISIDGQTIERTMFHDALPKEMVDSGKVFALKNRTENKRVQYYAEPLSFTINSTLENSDYYAVSFDSFLLGTLILTGYENLSPGEEVFLIKGTKQAEDLSTDNLFQ